MQRIPPVADDGSPRDFQPHSSQRGRTFAPFPTNSVYHAQSGSRSALTFALPISSSPANRLLSALLVLIKGFVPNLLMRITDAFLPFPLLQPSVY